jgi:hypothetical protein
MLMNTRTKQQRSYRIDLEFVARDSAGSIEIIDTVERRTRKAALRIMEAWSHRKLDEVPSWIHTDYPEGGRLRVWATCFDEEENDTTEVWSWEEGECVYHTIPN